MTDRLAEPLLIGLIGLALYAWLLLAVVTRRLMKYRYGWDTPGDPPDVLGPLVFWPFVLAGVSLFEIARRIVRDTGEAK